MKIIRNLKMYLLGCRPIGRSWYQHFEMNDGFTNFKHVGDRGRLRTNIMLKALDAFPFLNTDVVTDIGSNASVFGQYILGRVSKVYGIEIDQKFHRQAKFLKSLYDDNDDQRKLILLNRDIQSCVTEITASTIVFISKVLYHKNINKNQQSLMGMILHPNLRGVIMQGHTTQGEFGSLKFIEDFMMRNNFDVIYKEEHHEYPIVCGVRNRD